MSDHASDRLFREGKYVEAAAALGEGVEKQGESGRDVLLYLLDQGLALHAAGKFEESNKVFLAADKMAEIKDYTSLVTEGATFLSGDNLKSYKGEDFEKVLINTYLAMNYALMGKWEDALVEARRVNRKLLLMVTEGQRQYKQNAFARYLSGIVYEAEGEWSDAYIDYKQAWELTPGLPGLGRDLWRMAWLLRMPDQMEMWEEKASLTADDKAAAKRLGPRGGKCEIIVLYENGISPVKRPDPGWSSLPKFYPRSNPVSEAHVRVDGVAAGSTVLLHDIESTAIANLNEKWGGLLARKIAGVVVKEVAAKQIENATKSELAGLLARVFFYVSDQADLRSWNLLPRDLQIARVVVDPGIHTIALDPVGSGTLGEKTVSVEAGKKVFVNFRYTPY